MVYYRRNLYILSITIFLAALSWNQVMPFIPLFLKDLGVKHGLLQWVGVIFAAQAVASMIAQPFWGKLGDRLGRKPMILRAGLCLAGVYFGMSICTAPWQLALLRFLNGALTGFIPGSYALIATNTPDEHAPRSVATAQTAANAGLIAGPALGGFLAVLAGYRGSMQLAGALVLLSTVAVWLFVREPNKTASDEKTSLVQDLHTAVKSPVQVSLMVASFVAWVFGASVGPYLTLYLRGLESKPPEWLVGMVFALPAVAFVLSARKWTELGERVGYAPVIRTVMIGGGLSAVVLAGVDSLWLFSLLYFVVGLWMAGIAPLGSAIICTKIDVGFRGRAYGIQQSAGTLGALIGPLAAGWTAAAFGIRSVFVLVGVVAVVGSVAFSAISRRWAMDAEAHPDVSLDSDDSAQNKTGSTTV